MKRICGNCLFLIRDDGDPYCAILPLYTEREKDDSACEDWKGIEVEGFANDSKTIYDCVEVAKTQNGH